VRNTFRFLLRNLYDYDPSQAVEWGQMPVLDRFAMVHLADALEKTTAYFDEWRFYMAMRTVSDYLGSLSNVYLDAVKDRLYADAADSLSRRSAQTVLAAVLGVLVRALAPVLSFTCEEVWTFMPESMSREESVQLASWPTLEIPAEEAKVLRAQFDEVLAVRVAVTKALEDARNENRVGKSQEAAVSIRVPAASAEPLRMVGEEALAELFIVAKVAISESDEVSVDVSPAEGEKCARCWNYREIGVDPSHADVCARCAEVLTHSS
jgi:isoleucyl-tRNA synthetase